MSDLQKHIDQLFAAELQFRLASAVELATARKVQPLDLPMEWAHGKHTVRYEEIVLRPEQADFAACMLHRSATFLMAVVMRRAIPAAVSDLKSCADSNTHAAYQIARMIRNAFAYSPLAPVWSIDADCSNKVFSIPDVITLDTTGLNGNPFDWRHYGGPLALFRLCQFVRTEILGDPTSCREVVPPAEKIIYQQGNLILERLDSLPAGAVKLDVKRLPDGGLPLGNGHVVYTREKL